MAFDVAAARNAGKSDAEIADYLGSIHRFDVTAARQAGKTDTEIADYLSSRNRPASPRLSTPAASQGTGGTGRPELDLPAPTVPAAPKQPSQEPLWKQTLKDPHLWRNIADAILPGNQQQSVVESQPEILNQGQPTVAKADPIDMMATPALRAALRAEFDASDDDHRAQMADLPGISGQVIKAYQAEKGSKQAALDLAIKKQKAGGGQSFTGNPDDASWEARAARLTVDQGMPWDAAVAVAKRAARRGVPVGQESAYDATLTKAVAAAPSTQWLADQAAIEKDQNGDFTDYAAGRVKDLTADALKVLPTAAQTFAQTASMLTGGAVGARSSRELQGVMENIDQNVGTAYKRQQASDFAAINADDKTSIGDSLMFLLNNPNLFADQAITTVGSSIMPGAAAGFAAKAAKANALARGLTEAEATLAASRAATKAVLASNALMNGADTFQSLEGQPLESRYAGAMVSATMSMLVGKVTEGGAEGAIARKLIGDIKAGDQTAIGKALRFLETGGKEGIQESGEEIGNIAGEVTGGNQAPTLTQAGKRVGQAGIIGAAVGGGAEVATLGVHTPAQAQQEAIPQADDTMASPPSAVETPVQAQPEPPVSDRAVPAEAEIAPVQGTVTAPEPVSSAPAADETRIHGQSQAGGGRVIDAEALTAAFALDDQGTVDAAKATRGVRNQVKKALEAGTPVYLNGEPIQSAEGIKAANILDGTSKIQIGGNPPPVTSKPEGGDSRGQGQEINAGQGRQEALLTQPTVKAETTPESEKSSALTIEPGLDQKVKKAQQERVTIKPDKEGYTIMVDGKPQLTFTDLDRAVEERDALKKGIEAGIEKEQITVPEAPKPREKTPAEIQREDMAKEKQAAQPQAETALAPVEQATGKTTVKLYRGVEKGRDATATSDTESGALFYSPLDSVAEKYAGEGGQVVGHDVTFNNLLTGRTLFDVKKSLGLPKMASTRKVIETAREKGYDGLKFSSTDGVEYVHLPDVAKKAEIHEAAHVNDTESTQQGAFDREGATATDRAKGKTREQFDSWLRGRYGRAKAAELKASGQSEKWYQTANPSAQAEVDSSSRTVTEYPMAPRDEWHGEGTYKENGGRLVQMSPDEYLSQVRPLKMDDESRENIDILKKHILDGKTLDPLLINKNGKEDGRHRAVAAKELGIKTVPVIDYRQENVAATESPAPAEKNPANRIEDFGEKLEGARKDYAAKLREALDADIGAVPLSESWPEPDYQKLLKDGSDPWAVGFMHAARDEIPTKPQRAWKLQGWIGQVKLLRDTAEKIASGQLSVQSAKKIMDDMPALHSIRDRIGLYEAVGHDKSLKGIRVVSGQYSVFKGVAYNPPKVIWSVEHNGKNSATSTMPNLIGYGDTKEAAIETFKKTWMETSPKQDEKRAITFEIYSRRSDKSIFIGKKIGKNTVTIKDGFADVKAARAYLQDHHDDLVSILERMKDLPGERRGENSPRVGVDHRNGADVTPQQFSETFGFRGVQFGNYVEGARRQNDLNESYDALMDLAGLLGVPPKSLSLNGELGLAFGARGKGGKNPAKAHYERDHVVINLTKNKGAGSLAHEWFHGLDNYFARRSGQKHGFATLLMKAPEGMRPEVFDAFKGIVRTLNGSDMMKRSFRLDQTRSVPYWGTIIEMGARAFEAHIIAKLQDQSMSNDYLANIVSQQYWDAERAIMRGPDATGEKPSDYPYPTEAEMPAIRAAFDHFFQTVETRETESGIEFNDLAVGDNQAPIFHSSLTRAAQKAKVTTGTGSQWLATLRNIPGVKAEEIDATDLEQFLGDRKGITKQEVVDYLSSNGVQVTETMLGGEMMDGLQREHDKLVVQLTSKGFTPSHYTEDGQLNLTNRNGKSWLFDRDEVEWVYLGGRENVPLPDHVQELADQLAYVRGQMADPGLHSLGEDYADERDSERTKYGQYTLPGGHNYRELLLTLPTSKPFDRSSSEMQREAVKMYGEKAASRLSDAQWELVARSLQNTLGNEYKSIHWNQPNVLAHIRFDERTDADGKRVMHIAEVQSDWHQQGRKYGYLGTPRTAEQILARGQSVPDAPFKTTWPELAMKRAIRYAAENGFDRVTWDTGDTNADRYDLSKQINIIRATRTMQGAYRIEARTHNNAVALDDVYQAEKLPDVIGKDLAKKIVNQKDGLQVYSGVDLKVGGEGMRAFYDKIMPTTVGKLIKK